MSRASTSRKTIPASWRAVAIPRPANVRVRTHPELLRDLAERESLVAQRARAAHVDDALGTADVDHLSAGARDSSLRALDEVRAFLLGDPTEDRDQQRANGSARVEPRLAHADDLHAAPIELEDGLQVAHHGSAEAIQGPHDEHVERTAVRVAHHLVELRARLRGADLLL